MDGIGQINEEEDFKNDCSVFDDFYAPVDGSLHKRSCISDLAYSNGGLERSEHSNEEEDQTTEFDVENYCGA